MPQYISDGQSGYEADLDNLIQAVKENGVISGLAVTAQTVPNLSVQVASGVEQFSRVTAAVGAVASIAITAGGANPRIDLIYKTSGVAPTKVEGTAAASPKPPALPVGGILLAYVSVAAGAVNIQNSNITNRIITVPDMSTLVPDVFPQPNLVPNSDFNRRTKWMTFMPEVFADTSGWTAVDGSLGTVAANIHTAGTNGRWSIRAGLSTWRDGRWSGSVRQVGTGTTTAALIGLAKGDGTPWASGTNIMAAFHRTGANTVTLLLYKTIASSGIVIATLAGLTWTDNNWGWLELEAQGTTYTAKLYNSGAAAGAKSAATLLGTLVGTATETTIAAGYVQLLNDNTVGVAAQWGGLSTGDGGVYVEGYGPESLEVAFGGTKGGQAIGFDEAADAGPIGKQIALRHYIPAASRSMDISVFTADGTAVPSVDYIGSVYMKVSGKGGTGNLLEVRHYSYQSDGTTNLNNTTLVDAAEAAWTRKTGTITGHANARRFRTRWQVNPAVTATGTVFVQLNQIEQGIAATAWRNAPGDATAPFKNLHKFVNWAATTAFDLSEAPVLSTVLQGATTVTLSNPVAGYFYQLRFRQDHTGSRIPTFPSTVKWAAGTAPTFTTTANRTDIVTLSWQGSFYIATVQLNFDVG